MLAYVVLETDGPPEKDVVSFSGTEKRPPSSRPKMSFQLCNNAFQFDQRQVSRHRI
jgi:hypothetical protein